MKKKFFIEDFLGVTVNRLTIRKDLGTRGVKYRRFVLCDCICGRTDLEINFECIIRNTIKSCGCLLFNHDKNRKYPIKHGYYGTKEYNTWTHLIGRCCNKNNQDYPNYGGRGITVCKEWREDFLCFLNDIGHAPTPKHSVDRINVNGHYERGNVYWATSKEQQNNKRTNYLITYNGETKTLQQWSDLRGWHKCVIRHRLVDLGWSIEKALTIEPRIRNKPSF